MTRIRSYEFDESDFIAVDRAIMLERDKSVEGLRLMRRTLWERWGRAFLYISGGISLLILAISLAYWLWRYEFGPASIVDTTKAAFPAKEAESRALDELDQNNFLIAPVDTSFIVFNELIDDYGRVIVTGRKFEPTDFEVPVEQYCYIENIGDKGVESITLAEYAYGLINVVTTDAQLARLIEPYCNFTESKDSY